MCRSDGQALCPALLIKRTKVLKEKNCLEGSPLKLLAGHLPFPDYMTAHKIASVQTSVKSFSGDTFLLVSNRHEFKVG